MYVFIIILRFIFVIPKDTAMKLVERVLDNIPSEEISDIATEFGFSSQKMSSVIHAVIPGILSAFKARIVSSMNSGDLFCRFV